jgi:hypothetical protein
MLMFVPHTKHKPQQLVEDDSFTFLYVDVRTSQEAHLWTFTALHFYLLVTFQDSFNVASHDVFDVCSYPCVFLQLAQFLLLGWTGRIDWRSSIQWKNGRSKRVLRFRSRIFPRYLSHSLFLPAHTTNSYLNFGFSLQVFASRTEI